MFIQRNHVAQMSHLLALRFDTLLLLADLLLKWHHRALADRQCAVGEVRLPIPPHTSPRAARRVTHCGPRGGLGLRELRAAELSVSPEAVGTEEVTVRAQVHFPIWYSKANYTLRPRPRLGAVHILTQVVCSDRAAGRSVN